MRFHQSWYRAHVLQLPWGTGPRPKEERELGSMLRTEDAAKGANFLTPEIHAAANQRLAGGVGLVEKYRLLHNMLSSQPMCFNLFAPMVTDLDLATRVFDALLPDDVEQVSLVTFEHAPVPPSDYLDDKTAFDCYVEYVRQGGGRGLAGIETKLTEPFSPKRYDSPAYRRWVERPDSPWPETSWGSLAEVSHNQLWRDHLLAIAMLRRDGSPYESGCLVLARHPMDVHCTTIAERYGQLLKKSDTTFMDCPIDRIVDAIEVNADDSQKRWFVDFRRRYLDLSLSEKDWGER